MSTYKRGQAQPVTLLIMYWLVGALAAAGCMSSAGERELLPEAREGVFFTRFAEAQREALGQNKHILLDMWRPG